MNARSCLSGRRLSVFLLGLFSLIAAAPAGDDVDDSAVTLPRRFDLATARELAINHSRVIAQARERIREQEGVIIEAKAAKKPRVDLNTNYDATGENRIESFGGLFAPIGQKWSSDVSVAYTVLDGRFRDSTTQAAEASRAAAAAQMEAVIDDVLLQVSERYFDALLATDQIDVQEKAIGVLDEQLNYAKNRFDAGTGPQFDVLQAEVARANARPPLVRAQSRYKSAIDQLRRAIGLEYPEGVEADGIELAERWPNAKQRETLDNAIHQAMENRSELAALKSQIAAGEKSVEAEKARHKPKLEVVGGYGAQSLSFTDDITDGLAGFVGGVRLSIPIFDGGMTRGRVLQARSRLRQTEISTEQEKLNIAGQVREAWFDWEEGTSILETSQLVVKQAEEALRLARASFEAGAATQLDVLQSQLELTRARLEEVVALHTYHTALARLRRAMGAGR